MPVYLLDYSLCYLGRQSTVAFMLLHDLVHRVVVQVFPFCKEDLSHNVKCGIVQILEAKAAASIAP